MNFPEKAISHTIRSFVSEKDIETQRQKRQEEYEKTRKPDDPLEAPEEEYDPRTLFDRLKEQKMKKQEEFEETHKLKNMIRGLDNDETSFLESVDKKKIENEEQKLKEEELALTEYQTAVSHLTSAEQEKKLSEFKKSLWTSSSKDGKKATTSKRSQQAALLVNAVKRKSDVAETKAEPPTKKPSTDATGPQVTKCIGILPGLGCYDSDSDESENSSNSEAGGDELEFGFQLIPRVERQASQSNCAKKA